jgi:hypothetical protein
MTTDIHFSQIDIEREVTNQIQSRAADLEELRELGELTINITASTLFYLEALGYMVDFATGVVTREIQPVCQEPDEPVTS